MEKNKEVNFEESLSKLEVIVKELENGEVSLDDAIEKFNEAMKLVKICDDKLKSAQDNISKIVNENGTITDFNISEE